MPVPPLQRGVVGSPHHTSEQGDPQPQGGWISLNSKMSETMRHAQILRDLPIQLFHQIQNRVAQRVAKEFPQDMSTKQSRLQCALVLCWEIRAGVPGGKGGHGIPVQLERVWAQG